jgi:hypothetical protein
MKTNRKAEEHIERDRFVIPWEENVFPPRPKGPSDYHLNEFELITDVDVMREIAKYYYNSAKQTSGRIMIFRSVLINWINLLKTMALNFNLLMVIIGW